MCMSFEILVETKSIKESKFSKYLVKYDNMSN